ncbi:MAG: hypothetical protein BWY27_00197 [Bacteroidetes bacterium ADurb.Bin234]|jgi:hypothetical protein|nr:MAG: hypothetical protein BWY27_00197 [Bacteroidetes bacterium ADurb.Bin234]
MAKLNIVIFACIVALTSCNKAPDCSFESPKDKDIFSTSDSIVVTINAEDKKGSVTEVSLHIDNNLFETIKYTPYQFTIPSGTLSEGSHTLKATATDNEGAVGEATITLTVNPEIYAVGDMYDVGGVKGQVYKITDGGKHGMIISLDNSIVRWSTDINATNIQSLDDGVANMSKVKSSFDINNFPAFKWCDDKNVDGITGWYLPAINEVVDMHSVRDQLDINFSSTERMVWSSTEVPTETESAHVKLFNQDSPILQKTGKLRSVVVIAVKKF